MPEKDRESDWSSHAGREKAAGKPALAATKQCDRQCQAEAKALVPYRRADSSRGKHPRWHVSVLEATNNTQTNERSEQNLQRVLHAKKRQPHEVADEDQKDRGDASSNAFITTPFRRRPCRNCKAQHTSGRKTRSDVESKRPQRSPVFPGKRHKQ